MIKNHKSSKSGKTGKSEKVKKWQNAENEKDEKVIKLKSTKINKKSVKNHQKWRKPVLRPKMQKTGVHAEWQKCPHQMARKTRKVTFTPLSDIPPLFWPFFMCWHFFDHFHFLTFLVLSLFAFCQFWCFCVFHDFCVFIILRHYCNKALLCVNYDQFHVGENSQERRYNFKLPFSPLFVFCFWF